ncbi:MAG: glycosyltransferase [Deltaproteobacteria bacterium]|nr:glycosyltransferase [Deltaproteobacteria bacterium]
MSSILAIQREDVVVRELVAAIEVTMPVSRVPWRSPIASMLGERLLRPTTGRIATPAGRVIAKSLALVTAAGLAVAAGSAVRGGWPSRAAGSPRLTSRRAVLATSPDQADLVASMSGPRFYHAIDDFTEYAWASARVLAAERRIVDGCRAVFAVSNALAETLCERHGLSRDRVIVVPNGVPADMIPADVPRPHLRRDEPAERSLPIAGVLGSLSSRLRLDWLRQVVDATPWLSWRFVGGIEEAELAPGDRFHLRWLEQHPRCRFEGPRPYRDLVRYATLLDVAVMPYSDRITNASGSPTRLFTHLAAGHPMLATPGCPQIEELAGSLVTTCEGPETLVTALEGLRDRRFDDGLHRARWEAAHRHTWAERARVILDTIHATVA